MYEIECKEEGCSKKYIAQTGRSWYERIKELNIYYIVKETKRILNLLLNTVMRNIREKIKIGIDAYSDIYFGLVKAWHRRNIDEINDSCMISQYNDICIVTVCPFFPSRCT